MSTDPLRFRGDHTAPTELADVMARRPVLGAGRVPEEVADLAARPSVLIEASEPGREPKVDLSQVSDSDGRFWRATVAQGDPTAGYVPGRTALRAPAESFLAEIDESVSVAGYRPTWSDLTFSPRPTPRRSGPTMRRLNGRPMEPLDVFGADDRTVFQDAAYPWGTIGRVFTPSGSGTAVLVGPRLVLTAGHMVPWGASGWWMRFVPAYFDGSSLHGAGVESYVSDTRGFDAHGDVTGYDWALLRLYEPLGERLGYFGYNGYDEDWNDRPYWSIVGYPGAVAAANRPSYQASISIFDVDDDSNGGSELESQTADLTPGNSGGPMFAWWGRDPRVVGVVSGAETDYVFPASSERGNVMAGGSGMGNLIAWGRTNWPL